MRIGHWRVLSFTFVLVASVVGRPTAQADGFHHTIPPEVLARDLATGEPYMAPPIPWGHYAKSGIGDSYFKKPCSLCGLFHKPGLFGKGCGGAGSGKCGHGLFNHCGSGAGGDCGGAGCGGLGLFSHSGKGHGDACGEPGCGGHGRRIKDCGLCKGKGCGLCRSSGAGDPMYAMASSQAPAPSPVVMPAPQSAPMASGQCGDPGCKLGKGHGHGGSMMGDACGDCGGRGCGKCHGLGRMSSACGSCGGNGCGKCGGLGRLFGGCGFCGGKGCGKCGLGGVGGIGSHVKGKISGLFHHNSIKYFVGPGGPVPLTPGYVPYVVPTRSPRDFLAFPPYTPSEF